MVDLARNYGLVVSSPWCRHVADSWRSRGHDYTDFKFCSYGVKQWEIDHRGWCRLSCTLVKPKPKDGYVKMDSLFQFINYGSWSADAAAELMRQIPSYLSPEHNDIAHRPLGSNSLRLGSCDPHRISMLVPVYWWPEVA